MTLKIVHLSFTPLAGQPYRLVNALQRHLDYDVHLIDHKRWNIYPHDLVFSEEPERCVELILSADIIHFHNYLDLNSKAFAPINFYDLHQKGKAFICHVHSEPVEISMEMGVSVDYVLSCNLPTLVIAQYPERFFPNALVIQNNLPLEKPDHLPIDDPSHWDIFFSPTKKISAWEDRWNTKGAPETKLLMEKIERETGCHIKIVTRRPLTEVLYEKQRSYIVLDDMITGSYHLSGLEGLSMAKPTLSYLDGRIQRVLLDLSGAKSIPFINAQFEDAGTIIKYLLTHRDEGDQIGVYGRQWLEQYWSEESIIHKYKSIYDTLLHDPSLICRQKSLQIYDASQKFFSLTLPNLLYENRKKHATSFIFVIYELLNLVIMKVRRRLTSTKKTILSNLPKFILIIIQSIWGKLKS